MEGARNLIRRARLRYREARAESVSAPPLTKRAHRLGASLHPLPALDCLDAGHLDLQRIATHTD